MAGNNSRIQSSLNLLMNQSMICYYRSYIFELLKFFGDYTTVSRTKSNKKNSGKLRKTNVDQKLSFGQYKD
jgi:hypothetical protein